MTSIFQEAHDKAAAAGLEAAKEYINKYYEGQDAGACGFAWAKITNKGTSKVVRELKKVVNKTAYGEREAYRKAYNFGYDCWNPSGYMGQNVDAKYRGASVYVKVLTEELAEMGFELKAYAEDRLD